MTGFNLTLSRESQPEPDGYLCGDDLHVMLIAWNAGTPAARDVAFALADKNRATSRVNTGAKRKDIAHAA